MAAPGHGQLLLDLAADTDLELVWATTWGHEANQRIGPAIGLPELPVIEFDGNDLDSVHGWRPGGAWKWAAAAEYAGGRPLAWLDDELDSVDTAGPARSAFDNARSATPTLLCHIDPARGLRQANLATVRSWADTLGSTA